MIGWKHLTRPDALFSKHKCQLCKSYDFCFIFVWLKRCFGKSRWLIQSVNSFYGIINFLDSFLRLLNNLFCLCLFGNFNRIWYFLWRMLTFINKFVIKQCKSQTVIFFWVDNFNNFLKRMGNDCHVKFFL